MSARWRYVISEAVAGFVRNPLVTFAVILSAFVSLFTLSFGFMINRQVELITDEWYGNVEVSIFLCDGRECAAITDEQRESLRSQLEGDPNVAEVLFESKQQAYEKVLELFENQPNIIESVSPDAIPASFRVRLVDPEQFEVISSRFEGQPGVEAIVDQRELIEDLVAITDGIELVAFVIAAVQLVLTAVLLAVIIRLSMFARREQIAIMRLVGASNWYIRTPFLLEGVIAAVIGGAMAMGAIWALLTTSREWLIRGLGQIFPIIDAGDTWSVLPVVAAVGIGLAVVSSLVSLLFQERATSMS